MMSIRLVGQMSLFARWDDGGWVHLGMSRVVIGSDGVADVGIVVCHLSVVMMGVRMLQLSISTGVWTCLSSAVMTLCLRPLECGMSVLEEEFFRGCFVRCVWGCIAWG